MPQPIPPIVPRQQLFALLKSHAKQAAEHSRDLGLLFCKLNRFREVNAEYGFEAGDRILFEVFERLEECAKSDSCVARTGPNEFALILPFLENSFVSHLAAQKVIGTLSDPYDIEKRQIGLIVTVGVGLLDLKRPDPTELCLLAERALCDARQKGNPFSVFYPEQKQNLEYRHLEGELQHALDHDGFQLFYQPQVGLATGMPVGAEALIRCTTRAGDKVPPGIFLPIAEKSELIHRITRWSLHNGLRFLKEIDKSQSDLSVSINISGACFRGSYFVDLVSNALGIWGVAPERLTLEITESVFMADLNVTNQICTELRNKYGVRISVDNFGTGFCSLEYFRRIPADEIKVDRSFVSNMIGDRVDNHIVDMMIKIAHGVGLSVVAEGVEDMETLKAINDLDCDVAQGFYIGRPENASDVTSFLTTYNHGSSAKLFALGKR